MKRLFNKIVGRPEHIGSFGFIWGEETRFTIKKYYCSDCRKDVVGFNVDLANERVRETIFCTGCFSILDKPKAWEEYAIKGIPVDIEYADGSKDEDYTHDFLPLLKKINGSTLYHCGEPMELLSFINKSDNVYEHYFECPNCQTEKLIKSFK